MKKKTILFSSYLHGNMEALIEYYNKNFKKQMDDSVKIVYLDLGKTEKLGKIRRYLTKFIEYHKKYDSVLSDYASPILNTGRETIFMDYGYGLKMMPGLDEVNSESIYNLGRIVREKVEYIVTLSERDEEYFYKPKEFENFSMPKYIPLGQPRNDVLFDKKFIDNSRQDIDNNFKSAGKKIILYAPTWRGYDVSSQFPFKRCDFEKLNNFMEKNNYILLYRPHYIENFIDDSLIRDLNNIKIADVKREPYTQKLIAACDMIITDYSSIIVDFLILDKPIAFIAFDIERYNNYRGLVVDFHNDVQTPGPKINRMKDLIDYLQEIEDNKDSYEKFRKEAKKYYFTYFDGKSCERVWKLIKNCIDKK